MALPSHFKIGPIFVLWALYYFNCLPTVQFDLWRSLTVFLPLFSNKSSWKTEDADGKPDREDKEGESSDDCEKALHFLQTRDDPAESYYYWQLAGGGVDLAPTFLKGVNGNDCLRPPILRLPLYLTGLFPSEHASRCGLSELWSSDSQPTRLKWDDSALSLYVFSRLGTKFIVYPTGFAPQSYHFQLIVFSSVLLVCHQSTFILFSSPTLIPALMGMMGANLA